jgi:hypothetical protein
MKIPKISQEHLLANSPSFLHQKDSRRVPFQERAFLLGNIIGVNAYRVKRASLQQRLTELGYQVHETPHFLVGRKAKTPTVVAHWFAPMAVDNELGYYFMEELKPLGMLATPQDFADVFGAVVNSLTPNDPQRAWHLFATNTLQRYHALLNGDHDAAPNCASPIDVFAALYRRVCELHVGESLLDAGCSSGFLPLVVAERFPMLTRVVGIDIRTEPFAVARKLAEERHLVNVRFEQADLLSDDLSTFGHFDTVTVLHVLEHFAEADMYGVLKHLLALTSHRLIIAVPYEQEPESAYGHKQLFTRTKLEAVGNWCLEQLGGGQATYEDCAGGLLYIDRPAVS